MPERAIGDGKGIATQAELASVASGSPRGFFTTLAALQAAYPTGTTGSWLVNADQKLYFWNGSAWTASIVYNAAVLPDGSVDYAKTDFITTGKNLFDADGVTINGLDSTLGIALPDSQWVLTPFMKALPGQILYASTYGDGSQRIAASIINKIVFYDSNKNPLSSLVGDRATATVPANAAYWRCTVPVSFRYTDTMIEYGGVSSTYEKFNYRIARLDINQTYEGLQQDVSDAQQDITTLNASIMGLASVAALGIEKQDRIAADTAHANAAQAHNATQIVYDATNSVKQKLDTLQSAYSNLTTGPAPNAAEVQDIRLGADGTNRASAGAMVREIHAQQLDSAWASTPVKHGLNNINPGVNAASAKFTGYGATRVNLMGVDGGFETIGMPGWLASSASTIKQDANSAVSGTYGNLVTSTALNAFYTEKRISFLQDGKYYLFLAGVKNSTASQVIALFRFTDTNVGGTLNTAKGGTSLTSAKGTPYVKISPSDYSAVNQVGASSCNMRIQGTSTVIGQSFSVDEIRVFEITAAEYAKIDVDPDWTGDKLAERFPYVDGVKHGQGVGVKKTGKNLVNQFTDGSWTIHANASVLSPTSVVLNATAASQSCNLIVNVLPNTTYTVSATQNATDSRLGITEQDANGTTTVVYVSRLSGAGYKTYTFTTGAGTYRLNLALTNNSAGQYTWDNVQLELGSTATPFEPYNADFIFLPTILASNLDGSVRDTAYEREGIYYKYKKWQTGNVLSGSLSWSINETQTGYKRIKPDVTGFGGYSVTLPKRVTKFDGTPLADFGINGVLTAKDQFSYDGGPGLSISVGTADSGWADTHTPILADLKAFANGWKMNNGTLGTAYPGTGTKYWTPIVTPKANFVGKVNGSTVECPHLLKRGGNTTLMTPGIFGGEDQADKAQYLDGNTAVKISSPSGEIAQILISFNLIEHVLRKHGSAVFGAAVTTVDRVTWLKANIGRITANWYGYGSGPAGNKANFTQYNYFSSTWSSPSTNTSSSPSKLSYAVTNMGSYIDANGMVSYLSYADASDGTTASTVYTDYIDLDVELNVQTVPATGYSSVDYKPYTLDYVLATPVEEVISGAAGFVSLAAGGNQVELFEGVIVREKVTPYNNGTTFAFINHATYPTSQTKNRYNNNGTLIIFRNGVDDTKNWTKDPAPSWAGGRSGAYIALANYDPTAEYTVTYTVLDKFSYTANIVDAILEYKSTAKGVQAVTTQRLSDAETNISILIKAMVDFYSFKKSLGG
jgi:hypothetical protein